MEKTFSASEAKRNFENILDIVSKGDSVVIEHDGKPAVAIMPIEAFRQWQEQSRQAVFDTMRRAAERANMSPEEADELAAEAVKWARSHKE